MATATKRKVNSKGKGQRIERSLCKILEQRFGRPFERCVGSGNRWSQVKELSPAMKDTLVGDIVCPPGFLWSLECKGGYEKDIDFNSILDGGCRKIDEFLRQVGADAERCGKMPLLAYKRDRMPWVAFVRIDDMPSMMDFDYRLMYRDWGCVLLEKLLEAEDEFFFSDGARSTG